MSDVSAKNSLFFHVNRRDNFFGGYLTHPVENFVSYARAVAAKKALAVECQYVVPSPGSREAGGFRPRAVCGRWKLYRYVHRGKTSVRFDEWTYVFAYATLLRLFE